MEQQFNELKALVMEVGDLGRAAGLLGWDQRVMMPPKGASVRAETMATLSKLVAQKARNPRIGELLDELRPYEESLPYESDEASLIRVVRHDYEKSLKVPVELRTEMARTSAQANPVWIKARKEKDFSQFLPILEKQVALKHKYIECFDETETPYDVLLDDFERGTTTSEVKRIFDDLKKDLVPLIAAISQNTDAVSDAPLHGHFPIDKQREFVLGIVERFGFDHESWRLDPTVHPFASGMGINDIRITTRYYEDFIGTALFGTMHECGHGLYENGVSPALERTPLKRGASHGLHESQSRMWENIVGRSRPFWKFFFPRLKEAFPDQYANTSAEDFYRAMNKVQPSFIRVEADEATYNLHIILRFELEQEIINGKLALKDLPDAWNARFKEYMGIDIPDASQGVLQDIHWSSGMLGYFPTYSLGNIISHQIWQKVEANMPDIWQQFERGEFNPLREWLRNNLHVHGRKFTPKETLEKVVGTPNIEVGPYVTYLKKKFGEIYEL